MPGGQQSKDSRIRERYRSPLSQIETTEKKKLKGKLKRTAAMGVG